MRVIRACFTMILTLAHAGCAATRFYVITWGTWGSASHRMSSTGMMPLMHRKACGCRMCGSEDIIVPCAEQWQLISCKATPQTNRRCEVCHSRARASKLFRLFPAFRFSKPLVTNKALVSPRPINSWATLTQAHFTKVVLWATETRTLLPPCFINRLSRVDCMLPSYGLKQGCWSVFNHCHGQKMKWLDMSLRPGVT